MLVLLIVTIVEIHTTILMSLILIMNKGALRNISCKKYRFVTHTCLNNHLMG